jgi:4-aminobutyrate aminotransferase-like enzyme/Ser/Thr protein kinase RdoA (MazF antagonist)
MTKDRRPAIDDARAQALLRENYGLDGTAALLPGERDRNFGVRWRAADGGEARGVLKIAAEDEPASALELQAALLTHAARRMAPAAGNARAPLVLPAVLPTLSGAGLAQVVARDGRRHALRLTTWLPGTPMADVRPHPPRLREALGSALGRLDRALVDFDHPGAHRAGFEWDLVCGLDVVAQNLEHVRDPARRASLSRLHEALRVSLASRLGALRRGVVHNDANDHNVLVALGLDGGAEVTGLIDFGDALHTLVVAEVAVAGAYTMLGRAAPLAALADVVCGYHREHALGEDELEVLFDLARLRLAVSVSLAARNALRTPEDTYLQVSAEPAWATLERLARVHPAFAETTLRHAAGLDPAPRMTRALAWMHAHAAQSVPVVAGDLSAAPRVDLSVASALVVGDEGDLDVPGWGARVDELVRRSPGELALGFHDEARLVYDTPAFDAPSDELPERRTIHIGADVFGPAGTAVRAPFAGEVVSVVDNDAPLDYGPTVILRHAPAPGVEWCTLLGHLDHEVLTRLAPGMQLAAGDLVGRFGPPAHNGGWTPHLHLQLLDASLAPSGDAPGVCAPSERDVWLALAPDPVPLLRVVSTRTKRLATEALLAARRARLGPSLSLSYRRPLTIVKGRAQYLYDAEGRRFLDCVNNVAHVGHCHPHVVRAGQRQMAVLNTNTRYLHDQILIYTERLLAKLPPHLEVVYLVCSGSEANELALRLARATTGARDVLVQEAGYHGNTQGLIELSHYKFAGKGGFAPPPHVHVVPLPDPDRGLFRGADSGPSYVAEVEALLAQLAAAGRRPAAMLAEAIIGCGGQVVPPRGYLAGAFDAVRRAGGVAIADEVQVGFGRVGTHFWAFEADGAVPDIVTMGKPIGNGHPMGAVATTRRVADAFANGMEYFNTFGGNPVSCAIGEAVLDVIDDEDLLANVRRVSERFFEGGREIARRHASTGHPIIGSVRGRGMYVGIELVQDPELGTPATAVAAYVSERLRDHGVLVSTDGPHANVLKIKPPLVFGLADMDRLLATLDSVLGETPVRARACTSAGARS